MSGVTVNGKSLFDISSRSAAPNLSIKTFGLPG